MKYAIIMTKIDAGYLAHAPDFPECKVSGETMEQIIEAMQEMIQYHVDEQLLDDKLPPSPTVEVAYVEITT